MIRIENQYRRFGNFTHITFVSMGGKVYGFTDHELERAAIRPERAMGNVPPTMAIALTHIQARDYAADTLPQLCDVLAKDPPPRETWWERLGGWLGDKMAKRVFP